MKCQFYTYNTKPAQYYSLPSFKGKPKLNWNTESAKLLEMGLMVAAVNSIAQTFPKNIIRKLDECMQENQSKGRDSAEWVPEFVEQCPDQIKDAVNNEVKARKKFYNKATDPNIIEQYVQFYYDTMKNDDMCYWAHIDGRQYTDFIYSEKVVLSLDILGKKNLEAALDLGEKGFSEFCASMQIMNNLLDKDNLELLKLKINPENTDKYRDLQKDISKGKKEINKLLGKDAQKKRKKLEKEIDTLKSDKSNYKQIKELKSQIQDLYRKSDNSDEIIKLMQSINEKQLKLKELKDKKINLSPKEIIKRLQVINTAATLLNPEMSVKFNMDNFDEDLRNKLKRYEDRIIYDSWHNELFFDDGQELETVFSKDEIYALLSFQFSLCMPIETKQNINTMISLLMESETPESERKYHKALNNLIYAALNCVPIEDRVSQILDFENCDYSDDLILSLKDDLFFMNMLNLVCFVSKSYFFDAEHIFDSMKKNIETKKIFADNGIDYDKWAHYDKDSYIEQNITITAEAAKQKAVKNMCDELTNTTYMSKIPQKGLNSLYNKLGEIGVQVDKEQKEVKIDGREITFDDLPLIINTVLDEELNKNPFWDEEQEDEAVGNAVDLAINHFNQRYDEILNIPRLKESENVNIKVKKVDMNDIKYALCLGNHSHCCTALGANINEWTAPNYIMSKCISAIEVLADDKPVGNTMIYMAEVNGELALVLDDIELQIKYQNNDEIRDMIVEYAKKLCKEVGKPNIPIYANGGAIHKVDVSKFKSIPAEIIILGRTGRDEMSSIYLDFDQSVHRVGYGEIIESNMYKVA